MAGSNRFFSYQDDLARTWNCNLDESTYEQIQLGFGQEPSAVASAAGRIARVSSRRAPISLRYALCKGYDQHNVLVERKVYVGNTGAAIWQNPTAAASVPTLRDFSSPTTAANLRDVKVSSLVGEVRRFIPAGDTGITDGDVETYPA